MPVVFLPPSTDPLDGLNKPIPEQHLESYRNTFNDLARASTGQQLDWARGYIIQVARFDPSKGIPDLVEGYRLFREALDKDGLKKKAPQLVLIGHTSIDDPDATKVLHELQDTLGGDTFKEIRDDIYALRAPPDGELHSLVYQPGTRLGLIAHLVRPSFGRSHARRRPRLSSLHSRRFRD